MLNSENGCRSGSGTPEGLNAFSLTMAFALLLTGCAKPVEKVEDIRPVRAITLSSGDTEVRTEYPGEVRARVESRPGFRVTGKIVSRSVDVGSPVKRGQTLMRLDPQDLRLAQAQADAALKAADSNLALAKEELRRYQELRTKNFVSQAVLDVKETAYKAAQSSRDQSLAAYRNQANQAGYAALQSDVDGVVTSIDAEVGQVVAAGSPVIRIAQAGEKEVVIGIPENQVESLRRISDVQVKIWAIPGNLITGKIRELSPVADPATRTYAAKITLPNAPAEVRLGMTAYASFADRTANAMIRVPLSALFQDKASTAVWVVEAGAVKPVPVQVAGSSGNDILLSGGVTPGQTVVTAGVNMLEPGQRVKILEAAPVTTDYGHPAPAAGNVK